MIMQRAEFEKAEKGGCHAISFERTHALGEDDVMADACRIGHFTFEDLLQRTQERHAETQRDNQS